MTREMPQAPPESPSIESKAGTISEKHRISVVTPMFGGGVHPGNPDPVSTVRVPSIRGHLRFWWRVTRGWGIDDPKELARRETSIWGSTEEPSKVQVAVEVLYKGDREPCADPAPGNPNGKFRPGYPAYALFPFQGDQKKDKSIGEGCKKVEFKLHLSYPESIDEVPLLDMTKEVRSSLWAWCNFGGLGARTRRGAGALYCSDFAPSGGSPESLVQWLRESPTAGVGNLFDHTGFEKVLVYEEKDIAKCWVTVVSLLQGFRQKEAGRNNGNEKHPGRSLWPESETIRNLTPGRRGHPRWDIIPDTGFPRAEFGLPIVFHFKDDKGKEPGDTTLVPVVRGIETQRMGSPLILKPLALGPERAVPLVLKLRSAKPLEGVKLLSGKKQVFEGSVSEAVVSETFSRYERSPMGKLAGSGKPRSQRGSAIEAFLSFALENDYREVKA